MREKTIVIGRWHYAEPSPYAGAGEEAVILSKHSVAPAEIYEWGVDAGKQPFERYAWCEDDLYADSSYCKAVSKAELLRRLENAAGLFRANGYGEPAAELERIITQITTDLQSRDVPEGDWT